MLRRKELLSIALVTIMVLTMLSSASVVTAQATAWSTPQTVDERGKYSSLALDPAGMPRISYQSATGLKYASQSTDGESWANVPITGAIPGATTFYPSLAIDAAGTPYVSFMQYFFAGSYIRFALGIVERTDETWASAPPVPWTQTNARPSIAADGAGIVHLSVARGGDVWYVARTGVGTWRWEHIDNARLGYNPSLALDPTGTPHTAYLSEDGIRYASRIGDDSWTSEKAAIAKSGYPSLAIDATSTPHIAYFSEDGIRYASRTSDGTWISEEVARLEAISGDSICILGLDPAGTPHILYYDEARNQLMYASRTSDGTWTTEALGSGDRYGFGLAIDPAGTTHVSYTSTGGALLYIKREVTQQSVAQEVQDYSGSLQASDFKTVQQYNTYVNKLNGLNDLIKASSYAEAQAKISNDLLKRQAQWGTDPETFEALKIISNDLAILQVVQDG